ncbi:helix-turn-helix domain-containing protein [Labrys sp. KNU-23]|uniref:helix-turn-helix domain-containing protein n=1 Tax=Labrys sp. KNU-23 TaxID=2789216 RepID=UPI0011EFE3E1|nr:helix-turn-helix domain-containing protein [Labrys sp. KNU-23]QEN85804.1 helix-turn-helix domain-containing protein [Labrys sp. KNU-23]
MTKQSRTVHDEQADWPDVFRGGSFHVESHVAGAMDAAHWHDHVELNLLLEGHMTYLFQGRRETVEAQRLALFWAAIPHRAIEVAPGSRLICLYFPFQDFMALPLAGSIRKAVMHGAFLRVAQIDTTDATTFQRWVDEWPGAAPARQRLLLDEACLRIRRLALDPLEASDSARHDGGGERREGRSPSLDHAERMIEIINLRFGEELSIAAITAELGIHQTTATSAFRRVLGMSINEYILRFRLSQALHLLADTDRPILDVAYACGFGSASRFYDVFRARTGVTPRQFRSQLSPR